MKDANLKTNIKPPDLWIHHDQMELKALEKSSINGEASTSGVASNTLPRSGNQEYTQDNVHGNSSSLDKRTYVPSYMGEFRLNLQGRNVSKRIIKSVAPFKQIYFIFFIRRVNYIII